MPASNNEDEAVIDTQTTVPQTNLLITDNQDTSTRAYANFARRTTTDSKISINTETTTTTTTTEKPTSQTTPKQSKEIPSEVELTSSSEYTTELPDLTTTFDHDSFDPSIVDPNSSELSNPLDQIAPTSIPEVSVHSNDQSIIPPINKRPLFVARPNVISNGSNNSGISSSVSTTTTASLELVGNADKLNNGNTVPASANPNSNKQENVQVPESGSGSELVASSPRPFGFSKRTRPPIVRHTTTTPAPVSAAGSPSTVDANDEVPVRNKVSSLPTTRFGSLRPLSQFRDRLKVSSDPLIDPAARETLTQSENPQQTEESTLFVPQLSQNTRNTFSVRPSRFRSTTVGEYEIATADPSLVLHEGLDEEKPTTKVQPRRRFRPKFENGESQFNSGFETTTKFVERPLRPGIGNDLSSLTAGDFYKNQAQSGRKPSRRVWPSRTTSSTPTYESDDSVDASRSSVEVSSRTPVRRKLARPSTEIPSRTSQFLAQKFSERQPADDQVKENSEDIPIRPRVSSPLNKSPILRRPFLVPSTAEPITDSAAFRTEFDNLPEVDPDVNARVFDGQAIHIDNEILSTGFPVKFSLGSQFNLGSTTINRLQSEHAKQVTNSINKEFTDSPIIFLNSRRTTNQPLSSSVTPLLNQLHALSTLGTKPTEHGRINGEEQTEISNEASDFASVSIHQPESTESTVESNEVTDAPIEINSNIGKQKANEFALKELVGRLHQPTTSNEKSSEETYTTTSYSEELSSAEKQPPTLHLHKFRPSVQNDVEEKERNVVSRNRSRVRLPAITRKSPDEQSPVSLEVESEGSTVRPRLRRPSFRTTSSADNNPVTDSTPLAIRGRRPFVRSSTTTESSVDDNDEEVAAAPVINRFAGRTRKPFIRRGSTTTAEVPSTSEEDAIDNSEEIPLQSAVVRPNLNILNQKKERKPFFPRVSSTATSTSEVEQDNNASNSGEELDDKPFPAQKTINRIRPSFNSEEDETTVDPTSVELNTIRLFAQPIIETIMDNKRDSPESSGEETTSTSLNSEEEEEVIAIIRQRIPIRAPSNNSEKIEVPDEQKTSSTTESNSSQEEEVTSLIKNNSENEPTTLEPDSDEVNTIRLFAVPIINSSDAKLEDSTDINTDNSNTESPSSDDSLSKMTNVEPKSSTSIIDDSKSTTQSTLTSSDDEVVDRKPAVRQRRPLIKSTSATTLDVDEVTESVISHRGRRPVLRTSTTLNSNSNVDEESTIIESDDQDVANKIPAIRQRKPIVRTSTAPPTVDANSESVSDKPNITAVPNRRRKIIRRRKPTSGDDDQSANDNEKPIAESSTPSETEPKRQRKIIRKLVRKPTGIPETETTNDIDNTTTNIELLPVRGYFKPHFASSVEEESSELARPVNAKETAPIATDQPSRFAPRIRPKPLSIQEHINYDSTEEENYVNEQLANDESVEDQVADDQPNLNNQSSSTTSNPIIRPIGSRTPFRPVRPTVDATLDATKSTTTPAAKSYVRKYSNKFLVPNQANNNEENIEELPILGSVKPFGATRPNRFHTQVQNQEHGSEEQQYDDENEEHDDDERNDDEADPEEEDYNDAPSPIKHTNVSPIRLGRPGNRPFFGQSPVASKDNNDEENLPVPVIRPSILLSRQKTFIPKSRQQQKDDIEGDEEESNRRPTSAGYKPKSPRLRPTLPASTPSSRKQNIPFSGKFGASSPSSEPPTNQLLDDLDRNALNSRNKKIFEKNSKKHFTLNANTPPTQQSPITPLNADTNNDSDENSTTDDYSSNTNTVVTNSYGEEYSTQSLPEDDDDDDEVDDDLNKILLNELQESKNSSSSSDASTVRSARPTTTQKPTTLHHIFAIDYDEKTEAIPEMKETERNSELITQKLEKIAEVSRIVEISSQQLNSKAGKSTASNLVIEKLPTVDKLGEISRITLIKLVDYSEQDGRTASPEVVAARLQEKKARQLMSPEAIFSVETSTIPLEALFESERAAKQLKDGVVYATSLGETESSLMVASSTTELPPPVTKSAIDDGQFVRPLAPLLRPESNESSPLVISIANLDQVVLSKVPLKGNDNDDDVVGDGTEAKSAKVSSSSGTVIDAPILSAHPVNGNDDSQSSLKLTKSTDPSPITFPPVKVSVL